MQTKSPNERLLLVVVWGMCCLRKLGYFLIHVQERCFKIESEKIRCRQESRTCYCSFFSQLAMPCVALLHSQVPALLSPNCGASSTAASVVLSKTFSTLRKFGAAFKPGRHEWFAVRRLNTNSRNSALSGGSSNRFPKETSQADGRNTIWTMKRW